jgi:type II secretory pathway pseudopilin PulG
MSSGLTTGLIVVGIIVILIGIAYINQQMEKNRIERSRISQNLHDQINMLESLLRDLPQHYLHKGLKRLLIESMMYKSNHLFSVGDRNQKAFAKQMLGESQNQLNQLTAQKTPPKEVPLKTSEQVRKTRNLLEVLNQHLLGLARAGRVNKEKAKSYHTLVKYLYTQAAFEFYRARAEELEAKNKIRGAIHQYYQEITELEKFSNKNGDRIEYVRKKIAALKAKADEEAMAKRNHQKAEGQQTQLEKGMDALNAEDEKTRMKQVYD